MKRLLVAGLMPMLALLLMTGCGDSSGDGEPADTATMAVERITIPVTPSVAGPGTVREVLEVQARLQAARRQDLVVLARGIVRELPVVTGQRVAQGDLLLRLDPLPSDADAVSEAQVALRRAERELERLTALDERVPGAVAGNERASAEDAVEDARLALTQAGRDATNRELRAPFDGIIDGVEAEVGQQLQVGGVLGRLHDDSAYDIPVAVPETLLPGISRGLTVEVHPISGSPGQGVVVALPGAVDPETGTADIRVRVDDPPDDWRPGAYAALVAVTGATDGDVVLPRSGVLYSRNRPYAWEVVRLPEDPDQAVVRRAWLTLGVGDETRIIVTDGLAAGSLVIVEGTTQLADDIPVSYDNADTLPEPRLHEPTGEAEAAGKRQRPGR